MAVLFIAIVVSHLISCGTGAKWFIFMTDLGVMFLALHYVIDAVIVLCRWAWEKNNPKAHCKYSFSYYLYKQDIAISLENFWDSLSYLFSFCFFFLVLDHQNRRLNVLYKFAWAWQNAFFDAALFITIVYWIALHPGKYIKSINTFNDKILKRV